MKTVIIIAVALAIGFAFAPKAEVSKAGKQIVQATYGKLVNSVGK